MSREFSLPQEIWSLVIDHIHDDCFAWLVLRRVSSTLRRATEDCFARDLIRHGSITFNDASIRHLLLQLWALKPPAGRGKRSPGEVKLELPTSPFALASTSFEPVAFLPADARTRMILKLRGESHDRTRDIPDDFFEGLARNAYADQLSRNGADPRDYRLHAHRRSSTCSAQQSVAEVLRRHPPHMATNLTLPKMGVKSLLERAQFVCLNHTLKSLRIPAIEINLQARYIAIDWRSLCQSFYLDELWLRRAQNPHYAGPAFSGPPNNYHGYPNEQNASRWLFWDPTSEHGPPHLKRLA